MRTLLIIFASIILVIAPALSFSKDVRVKGYYRKDGTYVRSHVRSSPDSYKSNNYGPSRSSSELMNPSMRDNDGDGIPNYLDNDDDNDGLQDDSDTSQY
jgi:hypothetical protein